MIMKALLLVLVFSPAVFAQNLYMDDSQIANGRFWRETPHIRKDDVPDRRRARPADCACKSGYGWQVSGEISIDSGRASWSDHRRLRKGVRQTLSDGENLQINVLLAWSYVDAKLKENLTREQNVNLQVLAIAESL